MTGFMRKILQQFLKLESLSGIILFAAAIIAMIWANSPWATFHQKFVDSALFTINDGLMTLFFLLVGLELKRGVLHGALKTATDILLPGVAALGGILLPALIYIYINAGDGVALHAWATPVATDIAFALGVLSLFGKRVPDGLKMFLLALAIFDDLFAIIVIALFYTQTLSYFALAVTALLMLVLYLCNVLSVRALSPYLLLGLGLWYSLLQAGIHPTIAGVILAFAIPADLQHAQSPALSLEKTLHPYVAYLIMPIFALANAGLALNGISFSIFQDKIVQGIILGLFLGKQLGVISFSWLLLRCTRVKLPQKTSWLAFYGVALLCGIGFTMSLFLGTLSFQSEAADYVAKVQIGVITGSLLSAVMGATVLTVAFLRRKK